MRYAIAKENVELYDEYGFNYKSVQTFVRDVEYDHRKTGVDMNATLNEVEDYIKTNNLTDEFNTWMEGKEKEYGIKEVIFDGFTPSGNRRYVPNTLENVSKIMKKQGRNGSTGTSVSFQNFAARLMPSYGTLKDIRSKKGLLTSDREKLDKFREKWSNVFFELGMKCQPDATGTFDDYGLARLSEAAMTSDPQAYLKKEYNVDFSDEDTKRLKEMVKAIKEESPAMYFETKFERPVHLDEFAAAVVPTTASNEVKQALQNAGVQIYEYDKEKEGDRSRAFNEAINSNDTIRFSLDKDKGTVVSPSKPSKAEAVQRDAVIDRLRENGMEVITDVAEGQKVLDEANGHGESVRSQVMLSSLTKAANTIRGWITGNKRGKSFTIELPETTRRMIRKVMGRDFDSHNITADGIRHGLKNHGAKGKKLTERSIPIRNEDAELIPYIMVAPDYVRKGSEDVTGRTSVLFYKELSNGYVVVAEKEYKNSPDDMETITIWAEMSDKATNAQRIAAPDTHVQNAILDIDAAKIRKDAEIAIAKDKKIREQRVYHGSGADFEAFDHSYIGSGEGLQIHGYGTYVSVSKGMAEGYARKLSDDGVSSNLYTVEIPNNTGDNYLEEGKVYTSDDVVRQKVDAVLKERGLELLGDGDLTGRRLYREVQNRVKGKKAASGIFAEAGLKGVHYFGHTDGECYVVFNEKDAKITDHVRFFRTANGEAYGFTVGGKIYVDQRIATSETPVHEYAHLWASALRNGNAEEWQNVVGLMKDSKVWDEVKGRYPELKTDDEIADEVIATYSGRRGAERLREEQRKIAEGDGGVFEKAEAISALEHVKRALKMFWKGVADFLHIHYKSAEEVADRVMKDLLEGVDPRKIGDGVDRQRYASLGVSRPLGDVKPKTLRGEEALTALDNIFNEPTSESMPRPLSTLESFKEVFNHPIRTFLGELVKVKEEVFNKIICERRSKISGAILSTIEDADFAIHDADGSTLYVKRYKSDNSGNTYNVVAVNKHGEVEDYVSSVHIKRDGNLRNKIKNGAELLLPQERDTDGTLFRNNSTPATKVVKDFVNPKESEGKDRQRWASWSLSEQQLDGDDTIRFSLRQEPAPKVTKKGYAVFIYKKLKNGGYKLVPKMLSNDPGAPAQTWLNADTGYMKRDENGEPLQNTNGRASVSVNGSQAGGNKSNKLAWRPGKHLAMYPNASQFKSTDGTIPKDVIFFEVEYAADPDLHKQYQRNAWELGMNDNGQYRNNQGGLPYIPKDSYYLYRTNSISEGATPMIITGAYKINRALTDAEAKELNQNAGGMWCPRKGGDLTEEKLKDMGLDDKGLKKMTESFDMDTIKESHDESDEARLLPGYKSREINWEDKDLIHSIEENGQDINDYRDGYVAPEHSEEPTIRFSLDKDKGTVVSPSKPSKAEAVLRDAVIDRLRENGMEVITDVAEGQKVLDEANGEDVMLSAKQKRALETATMADESTNKATVVSSADGAKVQNNLEILADSYKNRPNKAKGFITDLSRSLGLEQHEASQYGTFVTENGKTFTIRVSNHNARVSFFDKNGENDGISIVISNHKNKGLLNDGNAHIIEFFYSKQSLQRADSKPLSDIIRSVSETLYSGEFKDTTGLAERQEVNAKKIREQRVYHGSGAHPLLSELRQVEQRDVIAVKAQSIRMRYKK